MSGNRQPISGCSAVWSVAGSPRLAGPVLGGGMPHRWCRPSPDPAPETRPGRPVPTTTQGCCVRSSPACTAHCAATNRLSQSRASRRQRREAPARQQQRRLASGLGRCRAVTATCLVPALMDTIKPCSAGHASTPDEATPPGHGQDSTGARARARIRRGTAQRHGWTRRRGSAAAGGYVGGGPGLLSQARPSLSLPSSRAKSP
jgi:hypothetical protein